MYRLFASTEASPVQGRTLSRTASKKKRNTHNKNAVKGVEGLLVGGCFGVGGVWGGKKGRREKKSQGYKISGYGSTVAA